jgi:hypothetical protein
LILLHSAWTTAQLEYRLLILQGSYWTLPKVWQCPKVALKKFSFITARGCLHNTFGAWPFRTKQKDLRALQRMISQAELVLATIPNPHPSIARSRELLKAASGLSEDLATRPPESVALGAIGGKITAKRGPEYFAEIAAMRKVRAGGRPRKKK